MLDPTLSTAALATLETAVNAALRYDPGTCLALGELEGQVLAIELSSPALTLYLAPHTKGIDIMGNFEGTITTQLRGSVSALIALASKETSTFANSGVELSGDTALLVNIQTILSTLDIDWEEALSQILGDVVGHQMALSIRSSLAWLKGRSGTVSRLTGEYLTEELRCLPSNVELQGFYQDVDSLRFATDRLEARLEQIKQFERKGN